MFKRLNKMCSLRETAQTIHIPEVFCVIFCLFDYSRQIIKQNKGSHFTKHANNLDKQST